MKREAFHDFELGVGIRSLQPKKVPSASICIDFIDEMLRALFA